MNIFPDNFLLGDSAYACLRQLIVPYKDNGHLTRNQRIFNQKLSSCRVIIETRLFKAEISPIVPF